MTAALCWPLRSEVLILMSVQRASVRVLAGRASSASVFMRRFSRPFRSAAAAPVPDEAKDVAPADALPQGTLDQRFWSCPGDGGFRLRGKTYLQVHPTF